MILARKMSLVARTAALCAAAAWLTSAFAGENPAKNQAVTNEIPSAQPARGYAVLADFPGGPGASNPAGAIVQGRDGNLYSATPQGGSFYGTVFQVTPAGALTVINDISYFPSGGVALGTDGNFYGTNSDGGPGGNCGFAGCGQVYKVTPAGVSSILYNFTGFADGSVPQGTLVQGTDGNFYGTTRNSGGAFGTVFKISPSGAFSTIHTFTGPDGENPSAGVIQGTDGNFYGVTQYGGTNGDGVVFKITTSAAITVLYNFTDVPDGGGPVAPLIQASDGNFYGVAQTGGTFYGTIFKITSTGVYSILHTFVDTDGSAPSAALVQATDGKLYGTANSGGSLGYGTIFGITTGGNFNVLYNFDSTTGAYSSTPLKQHTNGLLYGDTYNGGLVDACNCGVFFSFNEGLGAFASLVSTSGKEGAKIGILGQGFNSSTVVNFDGVQATAVMRSGSTYLSATVPAGALTGLVTVTTGSTTLTSSQKFRVVPTAASFSPPSGPVGTPVIITGTGLMQATKVTFNHVTATTFTVNSDTQVTATVPTGATTGKISIVTPGGTANSATSFTVN